MSGAVVILQARMGSQRLPGKSLATIGDASIVTLCLRRLLVSAVGPVVLATTAAREDDSLVAEAARLGVAAVRGDRDDVLGRFAQAVSHMNAAVVIRATADNPAVDVDAARRALAAIERFGVDYCCERGLPYGGVVEGIRASALIDAEGRTMNTADREHVTPFIRRYLTRYRVAEPDAPRAVRRPDLRLTVDTAADLTFMRSLAAELSAPLATASFTEIIAAADRAIATVGSAFRRTS